MRKLQDFVRKHISEKVETPKRKIEDELQMGLIASVIKFQAAIRRFMARRIFLKNKKTSKKLQETIWERTRSADINQENEVRYEI